MKSKRSYLILEFRLTRFKNKITLLFGKKMKITRKKHAACFALTNSYTVIMLNYLSIANFMGFQARVVVNVSVQC